MPFPGFNENKFPLILIKEWECILILNLKSGKQLKIAGIETESEKEANSSSYQRLCFVSGIENLENEGGLSFITYNRHNSIGKFMIPKDVIGLALQLK